MSILKTGFRGLRIVLLFPPIALVYFIVSFLLLFFSPFLYGLFYVKGELNFYKVHATISRKEMPVLRPIPIATSSQKGFLNKLLAYMFVPRRWQLMQNWSWVYRENQGMPNEQKIELVVPKGFICDAASIPRPFRALLNPTGALLLPALLHDYAFKYNQLWQVDEAGALLPYYPEANFKKKDLKEQMKAWDRFLYRAGQQINGLWPVNATIRYLGWIGLTAFSWDHYRQLNKPVLSP